MKKKLTSPRNPRRVSKSKKQIRIKTKLALEDKEEKPSLLFCEDYLSWLKSFVSDEPDPDLGYWEERYLFASASFPYEDYTATKKQMNLIRELVDETRTVTQAYYELNHMGIGHAKKVISYLLAKKKKQSTS